MDVMRSPMELAQVNKVTAAVAGRILKCLLRLIFEFKKILRYRACGIRFYLPHFLKSAFKWFEKNKINTLGK